MDGWDYTSFDYELMTSEVRCISDEIQKAIKILPKLVGGQEKRKAAIRKIDSLFGEAYGWVNEMEIGSRKAPFPFRLLFQVKVREHEDELEKMRSELDKLENMTEEEIASQELAARKEMMKNMRKYAAIAKRALEEQKRETRLMFDYLTAKYGSFKKPVKASDNSKPDEDSDGSKHVADSDSSKHDEDSDGSKHVADSDSSKHDEDSDNIDDEEDADATFSDDNYECGGDKNVKKTFVQLPRKTLQPENKTAEVGRDVGESDVD